MNQINSNTNLHIQKSFINMNSWNIFEPELNVICISSAWINSLHKLTKLIHIWISKVCRSLFWNDFFRMEFKELDQKRGDEWWSSGTPWQVITVSRWHTAESSWRTQMWNCWYPNYICSMYRDICIYMLYMSAFLLDRWGKTQHDTDFSKRIQKELEIWMSQINW